jgi:hypothetical protein
MVGDKLQLIIDHLSSIIWRTFMRFHSNIILAAVLALAATPALAQGRAAGGNAPAAPGQIGGGNALAAPGPVSGAGLGFLVLAGGYYAFRRWRKQNPAE